MYKWPLNDSSFTWLDRLKICKFFLNPNNFWTQSVKVQEFEKKMAEFMGFKYAVFTSSGSTANSILAMYLKDTIKDKKRNIIVLPSTTWTTACAPFIREGFKPHFIDASLGNFGMDFHTLQFFLKDNHTKIAAVFLTSLLGFNVDYSHLKALRDTYTDVQFLIDQCENTFGGFHKYDVENFNEFTCSTSTYMGHELQSVEGGFLFTNKEGEYKRFLMYRNHGMVRSLENPTFELTKSFEPILDEFSNDKVDRRFDFYSLGSNFRNTDVNAFIGLLDFDKRFKHIKKRRFLYGIFQKNLNRDRYILPDDSLYGSSYYVPFCLPIICKGELKKERLRDIRSFCIDERIEIRPIISGFLGYQTAYKNMMNSKNYPNSIYLHENGIYVGLNTKVKVKQIKKLVDFLNKI